MLVPPPPYTLRPLTLADLPAIHAIDRLAFPAPAQDGLYEYELGQNQLAYYQALWHHDRLIGYAGYWLIADEAHVSIIAIHPDWRRRGLGELLLLNLLYLAGEQAATQVILEVRRSNAPALGLYQKYQFEQTRVRRRYYKDTGEDALEFLLLLNDIYYATWLQPSQQQLFARLDGQLSSP